MACSLYADIKLKTKKINGTDIKLKTNNKIHRRNCKSNTESMGFFFLVGKINGV